MRACCPGEVPVRLRPMRACQAPHECYHQAMVRLDINQAPWKVIFQGVLDNSYGTQPEIRQPTGRTPERNSDTG